jgi:hypothetical protein
MKAVQPVQQTLPSTQMRGGGPTGPHEPTSLATRTADCYVAASCLAIVVYTAVIGAL